MIRNVGNYVVDALRLDFLSDTFSRIETVDALLDVGCGEKPFETQYNDIANFCLGIDVPTSAHSHSKIDVFATATAVPFRDSTFNIILCTEVLEHVSEPGTSLDEFYRALVPGGKLILTTPFMVPEHEAPYDYFRYTRFGLEYLLTKSGFVVDRVEPLSELVGVLLSVIVQVQMKFWNVVALATRAKWLASVFNPLVFVLVLVPQVAYVVVYRLLRKTRQGRAILNRLSYSTKGFGVVATK